MRRDFAVRNTALVQPRVRLVVQLVVALWPVILVPKWSRKTATERLQATGRLSARMPGLNLGDVSGLVVRLLGARHVRVRIDCRSSGVVAVGALG